MKANEFKDLETFYNKLRKSLADEIDSGSVFLTLINKDNTPVLTALNNAAISKYELDYTISETLVNNGYIRPGMGEDAYILTAKGLWAIEKKSDKVSEDLIVEYFQNKKFSSKDEDASLNEKEKVILFSMVAVRAFSDQSCVDLLGPNSENTIQVWDEVVKSCYDFLKGTKIISSLSERQLLSNKGNEHPINFLFQHTDRLPKKTRFYFTTRDRKRAYYLDISEDGIVSSKKLEHIFHLIFEKKMDFDNLSLTIDFCKKMSYDYSIKVYDTEHVFSVPSVDRVVESALKKAILSI